jgi:hypothetical protein
MDAVHNREREFALGKVFGETFVMSVLKKYNTRL